jgi:2-C-methyl-D-erythritol 4-phosphate cytidylyltransferase
MEMEVGVIIAAAGSGTRLGLGSKALVKLRDRTLLARVAEMFDSVSEITRIVAVAPPTQLDLVRRELRTQRLTVAVCPGGETRQQSVRAGLTELGRCDYVLVHDVARPLCSAALVRRVLQAAVRTDAAVPGLPSSDTVMKVEGARLLESLGRSHLMLAQTPQAFRYQLLERAHFEASDAGLTGSDDAQLVAATGHGVTVVEGDPINIKLTTPRDMLVLEALLGEPEVGAAAVPST